MGAILFKCHHSFGDGLGIAQFFLAMSDIYDSNALPTLKPLSLIKKIMIYILSPFLVMKSLLSGLLRTKDKSCIHNNRPMTGRKKGA
jgi:hypothetical protein